MGGQHGGGTVKGEVEEIKAKGKLRGVSEATFIPFPLDENSVGQGLCLFCSMPDT